MRVNDIFAIENGEHIRILLCSEEQCYAVSCHHFRMPFPLSTHELEAMKSVSTEAYTIFAVDEDISTAQRRERDRRFALIKPLLDNTCICDKPHRNEIVKQVVGEHGVSRRTVLQYLWKYWVYQNKNILLPTGRASAKAHKLTADEKAIRWALNKYYYTPQKQSLQTAYKMMLRAKFCDAQGKLKPDYPTFWQFRYFFRKNRDPISETISRQGLKAYQRNHRPFTGSVCDYAHTIGVYMTDATVADIYIVSRLSRKPIGRPVIYTMVDTYSRLITGVYVGLEGGQYALRLLLQNTFTDKVSFCHQHGIDIDPQDWPSHHLPTKIMTDRGSEFVAGMLENLCENYHTAVIFAQMLGKGHAINTGRLNIQHGRIYVQQPPHGIGVLLYGRLFLYVYFMAGLFFPRFNLPYEPLHILCIIFQNQKVQLVFSPSKNVKSWWNFNSW